MIGRAVVLLAGLACAVGVAIALGAPPDGWTLDGPVRHFPGRALYGHIDGGAERFHELGFEELHVSRAVRDDRAALTLETYRMTSPEAALAIYLLQSGREKPVAGVAARNSGGAYQLSAVKGPVFLQVHNVAGDEALLPAMAAWANAALAEVEPDPPRDLFALLPEEGRVAGTEWIFRGPVTLEPIYTFGPGDILSQEGTVFGVAADYRTSPETEPSTRIVVAYADEKAAGAAFDHLVEHLDPYLEVLESAGGRILFRDYRERFGEARLSGDRLEIRIHLIERP